MKVLVSLIGEQPIPNLLPLRYFKPSACLGVHSDYTEKAAARLATLTKGLVEIWLLKVNAYDIRAIRDSLTAEIQGRGILPQEMLLNLTGGTKPMSLAAYLTAAELGAPVIYLQSEGRQSRLYTFSPGNPALVEETCLPGLIIIDDYLRAHIDSITTRRTKPDQAGHVFEQAVLDALRDVVDEIKPNVNLQGTVDLDMVVRCENQVGLVEAKLGSNHLKMAIDQLNTAAGREYLGTYTQKFLVSDQDWSRFSDLKALAKSRQIVVVELPGYGRHRSLSQQEIALLRDTILDGLGRQPIVNGKSKI